MPTRDKFQSFRLQDYGQVHRWSETPTQVRFFGPLSSYAMVWFKIRLANRRELPMSKLCLDWDPDRHKFVREICPYRGAGLKPQINYLSNGIVRSIQSHKPEWLAEHTGYERKKRDQDGLAYYLKERGSKSWTPVRLMRLPETPASVLYWKSRVCGDVSDPERGRDVQISYHEELPPADKYRVEVLDRTPLTTEEEAYLRFPVIVKPEPLEAARAEWDRLS
jgi:hypothetical protein